MNSKTIIALDFSSFDAVKDFLAKFNSIGEKLFVKVGMELFYKEGPSIVEYIKGEGHDIFLDLKLMDIPNTVHKAMKNLANLGVDLTNVHAVGGVEMMQAAKEALVNTSTKLIAVTYLTSISNEQLHTELLVSKNIDEAVVWQAQNTYKAGLDGVVCSALEAEKIHNATAPEFLTITPGIRPATAEVGDQKRVVTPSDAKHLSSDFIVVGRPITASSNPVETYNNINSDFN
jgi:orotidine-5'-phosphate decarboxylase